MGPFSFCGASDPVDFSTAGSGDGDRSLAYFHKHHADGRPSPAFLLLPGSDRSGPYADRLAFSQTLSTEAHPDIPRPGSRPSGRRLSCHSVEDRGWLREASGKRVPSWDAESTGFFTGAAYRFYFFRLCRGMGTFELPVRFGALSNSRGTGTGRAGGSARPFRLSFGLGR